MKKRWERKWKRQGNWEPGMWSRQSCGAHCQCGCGGCKFSFCRHGMCTSWHHRNICRLDAWILAVKSWAGVHWWLFPCRSAPALPTPHYSLAPDLRQTGPGRARHTDPQSQAQPPWFLQPQCPDLAQSTPYHSLVIWDEHKRGGMWSGLLLRKLHEHIHRPPWVHYDCKGSLLQQSLPSRADRPLKDNGTWSDLTLKSPSQQLGRRPCLCKPQQRRPNLKY